MRDQSWIAFSIDRKSTTPIFAQICEAIRQRVVSGEIEQGKRLPPSRSFAVELGVSRSTIVAAYEQLAAEGYAEGRHGSGFYVCPMGEVELGSGGVTRTDPEPPQAFTDNPPIPLHPGVPDMRLFPYRQWARCVARVARSSPEALVSMGNPFGDPKLREAIARHVAEWRGIQVSPRQILITAGSGDALEICIRALIEPGERIALEDPGYLPLRSFVESLGIKPDWLDVGPLGAEVPSARKKSPQPKLVALTPSHQFPLGGAMAPNRRMAFLNWAEETGGWIVEDDYDSEFRYAGRPIPALAGFDRSNRTIYVGSFSKIFSGSLRLGFLAVPESLTSGFAETLSRFGTKASIAPQRALATFMEDGEFYRHIRRVRRIYGDRRRMLLELLKSELGHLAGFQDHQAGMQIVLKLPRACDDQAIAKDALRNGVAVMALSAYFARKEAEQGLLLGFCAYTEDEIRAGIGKLRASIENRCR